MKVLIDVCRVALRPRVVGTSLLVILLLGVAPTAWAYDFQASWQLRFPAELYTTLWDTNPLVLLFALAVTLPYTLQFQDLLTNRFLAYTRTRADIRRTLSVHLLANAAVAFAVFVVIGLLPQLWVMLGSTRYDPASAGLVTADQIAAAEARYVTLSQLTVYGPWAFPVAYAFWLGLNAALYASLALCTSVLVPNRALGLSLPWVVSFVATFGFAVVGLEAFSPGLIFPFNLTQLPTVNLLFPLALITAATVGLVGWLLWRAPRLSRLQ